MGQTLPCEIFHKVRSSPPEMFLEKAVLKICIKVTGEHPSRSVTSIKFSCKCAAFFQNTFCEEYLWVAASVKCQIKPITKRTATGLETISVTKCNNFCHYHYEWKFKIHKVEWNCVQCWEENKFSLPIGNKSTYVRTTIRMYPLLRVRTCTWCTFFYILEIWTSYLPIY